MPQHRGVEVVRWGAAVPPRQGVEAVRQGVEAVRRGAAVPQGRGVEAVRRGVEAVRRGAAVPQGQGVEAVRRGVGAAGVRRGAAFDGWHRWLQRRPWGEELPLWPLDQCGDDQPWEGEEAEADCGG